MLDKNGIIIEVIRIIIACKIEPKFKIFPFSINHFIIVSQKVGAILQAIQFMRDKLCFD